MAPLARHGWTAGRVDGSAGRSYLEIVVKLHQAFVLSNSACFFGHLITGRGGFSHMGRGKLHLPLSCHPIYVLHVISRF